MVLKDYIKNLQSFVEENPEAADMKVVYAKDGEGNDFHKVEADKPCIMEFEDDTSYYLELCEDGVQMVCIN